MEIESFLRSQLAEPIKGMRSFKFYKFDSFVKNFGTTDLVKICKTKKYRDLEAKGFVLGFMEKREYFGEGWGYHMGLDIFCKAGTPVYSVYDGRIVVANKYSNENFKKEMTAAEHPDQWGNRLVIEHNIEGKTFYSMYAHLKELSAKEGMLVKKGQQIGEVGDEFCLENGGWPSHLHLQLSTEIIHQGYTAGKDKRLINPEKIFF